MTESIAGVGATTIALELLITRDRISIVQVADAAGISRSAAHRLMQTLVGRGYAVLGASGRGYSAAGRLLGLSNVPALAPRARFRLRPVLQELRERTGESVHTAVLVGDHVLVVDGRRSAFSLDIGLRVVMTAPANAMAAGKLLLAAMSDEAVVGLMTQPLLRRAPATIGSIEVLLAALAGIRRSGWSRAVQESEPGVNSIAVPLDGSSRIDRVALVISVPSSRGGDSRLAELARSARAVVDEFASRELVHPWRMRR